MKVRLGLIFFILITFFSSYAQTEKQLNEMDDIHQNCLDKGENMFECANIFYKQMDSTLNVVYKLLKKQLDTTQFKKLKIDEVKWLSERNVNFRKFNKEAQTNELGLEIGSTFAQNQKAYFVKDRVLFLLKKLK